MNNQEQLKAPGEAAQPLVATTFSDLNLMPEVASAIQKMGFKEPTPIQTGVYKKVMAGEDVIAMAQTGTGKTAAFGIPMVQMLDPDLKKVQGLVLTPTRELALQVCRELEQIGKVRGVRCTAIYGGASFTKQVEEVKNGVSIVVGTPGRVLDHIRRRTISFAKVNVLVLDEADEMLSMGFEKEISAIIESLPQKRQTMLFSATIPDDIQRLSKHYMGEAAVVSVSGDQVGAEAVSHFVYIVTGQNRMQDMVSVLKAERPDSALIFCNTRDETQSLARYLKKNGFNADWLNSDLSQNERERVMGRIRRGQLKFPVVTDVAARGIDISHISHVINFSFPESLEVYIHRTGRTGRMGKEGAAISLITPQDIGNLYYLRLTYKIFPIEKTLPAQGQSTLDLDLDRLDQLREQCKRPLDEGIQRLARRVMQDFQVEQLVGGLLAMHFSGEQEGETKQVARSSAPAPKPKGKPAAPPSRPARQETARRESTRRESTRRETAQQDSARKDSARTAPPRPEPVVSEPARPDPEPQPSEAPPPVASAPPKEAAPEPAKPEAQSVEPEKAKPKSAEPKKARPAADKGDVSKESEIFVDAGRKDGLRIATLMKEIIRLTGLTRSAVGRVRMLTRSTFISVAEENFDKVLGALRQIEIDGRKLKAEPKD